MFDFDPSEFLVIGVVAIVAIGPKDLPRALRTLGQWTGKMRRISGQLRVGVETMIREAERDDLDRAPVTPERQMGDSVPTASRHDPTPSGKGNDNGI